MIHFRGVSTIQVMFAVDRSSGNAGNSRTLPAAYERLLQIAEGLAQWLRSLPLNREVPSSIPGLVEG